MAFNTKRLFKHFLASKADLTAHAYQRDLEDFQIFLKADSVDEAITRLLSGSHQNGQSILARYKAHMHKQRELGAATINRRLSTLRSLGKEARILGLVPWVLEAQNVRHEFVRDTRGPGRNSIAKLLAHMAVLPQTADALRDTAIFRLMTDLALRRGTICKINLGDFDAGSGELKVIEKGKRSKAIRKLTKTAAAALSAWVAARGSITGALFVNFDTIHKTKTGKRLTGSSVYALLKKRAKEAGIKGPIRPHGVRHTSISMAAAEGAKKGYGLDKIREFSGHANAQTLERYLDQERSVQGELAEDVSAKLRST